MLQKELFLCKYVIKKKQKVPWTQEKWQKEDTKPTYEQRSLEKGAFTYKLTLYTNIDIYPLMLANRSCQFISSSMQPKLTDVTFSIKILNQNIISEHAWHHGHLPLIKCCQTCKKNQETFPLKA